MKVVYGHTDSIYVQIDDIDRALSAIKTIEEKVREKFPNVLGLDEHPVVLEFEKYFSALGVGVTKNRNAGMVSWEDGVYLDKPKFTMTGFEAKRDAETKLAKEVQTKVLQMWVQQKSFKDINKYLYDTFTFVKNGEVPLKSIIKRSRLKEDRLLIRCPDYECRNKMVHLKDSLTQTFCEICGTSMNNFVTREGKRPSIKEGIAGLIHAWERYNFSWTEADSYHFLKVKSYDKFTHPLTKEQRPVTYLSAPSADDFEGIKPDYDFYAEQVVKKAEPVYKAMGWDANQIRIGELKTLDEWW